MRIPEGKVRRSVERVDMPGDLGTLARGALLPDDAVLRKCGFNPRADELLGGNIGFGEEIARAFLRRVLAPFEETRFQELPGLAGEGGGEWKERGQATSKGGK